MSLLTKLTEAEKELGLPIALEGNNPLATVDKASSAH
jgi:hypothetical protein